MKTKILLLAAGLLLITAAAVLAQAETKNWLGTMKEHHGDDFEEHHRAMHGDNWEEHVESCHSSEDKTTATRTRSMMGARMV